jgi:hypothetical protein
MGSSVPEAATSRRSSRGWPGRLYASDPRCNEAAYLDPQLIWVDSIIGALALIFMATGLVQWCGTAEQEPREPR